MADEKLVEAVVETKIELAPVADEIVKESGRYFKKVQVDVATLIAEQERVIISLNDQISKAEATIAELSAKL